MKKSLLSRLPIENADDAVVRMAFRVDESARFIVKCDALTIEDGLYLFINIFKPNELKEEKRHPCVRVLMSKSDYISQAYIDGEYKWRTGCISSIVDTYWYSKMPYVVFDDNSSDAIEKVLETPFTGFRVVLDQQRKIMSERLKKSHQKEKDKIDRRMKDVPSIPISFDKWISEIALYRSRYIFYTYEKRKTLHGYCTHCDTYVMVDNPRHQQRGKCPNCGSEVTFIANRKVSNIVDRCCAYLLQRSKCGKGMWLRIFDVVKRSEPSKNEPGEVYSIEMARVFYPFSHPIKSEYECYEYVPFHQLFEIRWCKDSGKYTAREGALYDRNLKSVIQGTPWQYSAIREYATCVPGNQLYWFRYITAYVTHPFIEYFVKMGLQRLTREVVQAGYYSGMDSVINNKGKDIKSIFKFDLSLVPFIKKVDAGRDDIILLREAQRKGIQFTVESFKQYVEFFKHNETLMTLLKHTTVHKLIKFVKSNMIGRSDQDRFNAVGDYDDYIEDCIYLKYDLKDEFVLFPKNFPAVHQRVAELRKEKENEIENMKIKDIFEMYLKRLPEIRKRFAYSDKDLIVVIPDKINDIPNEGLALHHCVGNYRKNVFTGKTMIVFIREAADKDKPFYTCEIHDDGKIIQCRGMRNKSMTDTVKRFVDKYSKVVGERYRKEGCYAEGLRTKKAS